eukprot:403374734
MANPNYQSKENLLEDDYVPTLYVLPQVSCKTYCIIDAQKAKNLYYKGDQEIREIASLTKIMTAIVSLQLAKEMKLDINAIYFSVSQNASTTGGTAAYLRQGQRLKIIDLLHGMMLPSGNDAAVTLAENFGQRLIQYRQARSPNKNAIQSFFTSSPEKLRDTRAEIQIEYQKLNNPIKVFVKEMNKCAKQFHLKQTKYINPHGLSDKGNQSTAQDIAQLAFNCLKDPVFSNIVNKQKHECITYIKRPQNVIQKTDLECQTQTQQNSIQNKDITQMQDTEMPYKMTWFNSNKLLGVKGFKGVKTGITQTAGPCLCILYENETYKHKLITVVLGCKNVDYRWRDARRLTIWADHMLVDQKINAKNSMKSIPIFSQQSSQNQGNNL